MSSEIKNTIGLLCKLVNLIYKTDLKPEHFRLAKFNKTDENIVSIQNHRIIYIAPQAAELYYSMTKQIKLNI